MNEKKAAAHTRRQEASKKQATRKSSNFCKRFDVTDRATADAAERLQAAAITSVADKSERATKLLEMVMSARKHGKKGSPLFTRSMTSYSLDKALQDSKSPSRASEEKQQKRMQRKKAKQREKEQRRKEAEQRKEESRSKSGSQHGRRKRSLKGIARRKNSLKELYKPIGHGSAGMLSTVSEGEIKLEGNLAPIPLPPMAEIREGGGGLLSRARKRAGTLLSPPGKHGSELVCRPHCRIPPN
jgi:hypothetical protein